MQVIDYQARLELPTQWPAALRPEALNQMEHPTPFLVCDLETVRERYTRLTAALPGVRCFYALKCNSLPELLSAFTRLGASFEVASYAELQMLQALGVDPDEVTVVHSDTALVPSGDGTMGSRSLQVGGSAILQAAEQVLDKARTLAAHLLEARVEDVAVFPGEGLGGGLRHLGVTHVDLPLTPERVWRAIRAAAPPGT